MNVTKKPLNHVSQKTAVKSQISKIHQGMLRL